MSSYFNDRFNVNIYIFEKDMEYKEGMIVKYNDYLYIAKIDNSEIPTEKTTDDNWEFVGPNSFTNVIANIGCANTGYPISIGTMDNPFFGFYAMNSVNIVVKNKTIVPGFMGTLRFGKDMSDDGSTVNMNVLYDSDYQNPALIGMTERLNEIDLGSGIYRYKNIYGTTSPITLADSKYVKNKQDLDGKYVQLLSNLNPVEFTFINEHSSSDRTHIGFMADDVEKEMEKLNIDSSEFAALIKIPILKKDIYKDFEINEHAFGHYHYEGNEEVCDTELNYKQYLSGENIIRYCNLPLYSKELGYIYFKNYPLGTFNSDDNFDDAYSAEDMQIKIKSIELVPYDESLDNFVLDLSQHIITDDYPAQNETHHELLDDGSLIISFDSGAEYKYVRISLKSDGTNLDCSMFKYLKIVSDFKQPYLIGFSDKQSADNIDSGVDYFTSEYGDMYSYAQDNQYEVAAYIYALRNEELIPIIIKDNKELRNKVDELETRLSKLEALLNKEE